MADTSDGKSVRQFRWLHFSDLHAGLNNQGELWPRFGHLLANDLSRLIKRCGYVDLIIFSGDLVQKGSSKEFEIFEGIIGEILEYISREQAAPQIITLPGNHDLARRLQWPLPWLR